MPRSIAKRALLLFPAIYLLFLVAQALHHHNGGSCYSYHAAFCDHSAHWSDDNSPLIFAAKLNPAHRDCTGSISPTSSETLHFPAPHASPSRGRAPPISFV